MSLKRAPNGILILVNTPITANSLLAGQSNDSLVNTNIDAWRLRMTWAEIQPTNASGYNWVDVDDAFTLAHAHGKRIALTVSAGSHCPDWLFTEGCQYIQMAGSPSPGKLPIPGDAIYINRYSNLIATMGARYDLKHDLYYTVVGGIGDHFEWYYGNAADQTTLLGTYGNGIIATWLAMGKTFITAYANAFPTTPFMGAIGNPFGGSVSSQAEKDLVIWGVANYPKRFGMSGSTLSANSNVGAYPNEAVNTYYKSQPTGYQMLWKQTGDSSNRLQGLPASLGLSQSLTASVNLHGRYVEVYQPDCDNSTLQPTITSHRTQLKAIPYPV